MLSNDNVQILKKRFQSLRNPVTLELYTNFENPSCSKTEKLLNEIAAISDKISLRQFPVDTIDLNFDNRKIEFVPAILPKGSRDYGIRFYGLPSGQEFVSFIECIDYVSNEETNLSKSLLKKLTVFQRPTIIQVFVTPECPYCPTTVQNALSMAVASDSIQADIVMLNEFPKVAERKGILGVPTIVVNESAPLNGKLSQVEFFEKIKHIS